MLTMSRLSQRRIVRKQLSTGLLPNPDSTLIPPTYYFGWTLDAKRIIFLSKQTGIASYESDDEGVRR